MEVMVVMGMAVVTMARGRLKPSQDILEDMVVMVMVGDMEVMDMDVDIMERERLKLSQDILEDMVVMAVDMAMVVTDMGAMVIMVKFLLKFSSLPKDTIYIVLFHIQTRRQGKGRRKG